MTKDFVLTADWLRRWNERPVEANVADLASELQSPEEMVEDALDGFCRNPRGTPVNDSAVIEEIVKTGALQGRIRGSFDEEYFYGCRDMDGSDNVLFDVGFSVDPTKSVLTVTWEDRDFDERDPDDL